MVDQVHATGFVAGGIPDKSDDVPAASWELSSMLRVLLASCSLGAGAIHLAMVPSHAGEWLAEGVAFAVAGWLQVGLAIVVLMRPTRLIVGITLAANLVFIGVWVWTRTAGPPFGPEAGVAHPSGFVDITCVALEAVVVALVVVALIRPRLGAELSSDWYAPLSVIPIAVLVVVSAAIVSPSASGHDHEDAAVGGHDHGATASEAGHDHADPTGGDDKGLALLANGEMAHSYGADAPLDAGTRALLVHQLALTRLLADQFPTLKDARAAGSQPAGGYSPGLGIHMSTPQTGLPDVPPPDPSVPTIHGTLTDAEILHPADLLYDGTTDDARLAGFMYYSTGAGEPEGFAGPNDHWHTHGSLCVSLSGAGGKVEVLHPIEKSSDSCSAVGGIFVERTSYMVHVWTVPGYESNRGVFSDINPSLACPDGTYYMVPEDENATYKLNKCQSNPQ